MLQNLSGICLSSRPHPLKPATEPVPGCLSEQFRSLVFSVRHRYDIITSGQQLGTAPGGNLTGE